MAETPEFTVRLIHSGDGSMSQPTNSNQSVWVGVSATLGVVLACVLTFLATIVFGFKELGLRVVEPNQPVQVQAVTVDALNKLAGRITDLEARKECTCQRRGIGAVGSEK
jgi:hypothetical protein